ncbi:MAG: Uma2 family endonuclease [Sandaracinaceae bacterium]|nr:MAG: Uma2 family endonuclease [Sandaracinaceae bacterium]
MQPLHAEFPGIEAQQVRRLRRAEYDRLVEEGAFADERVELIRGVIIRMPPRGPTHAAPVTRMTRRLIQILGDRAEVRVQLPLLAPDDSEPEPDFAVVPPGDYDDAHPSVAWLVIEVAESSLSYDRLTKAPLYAAMGVPEYWIVNVREAAIEVHRQPEGDRYARVTSHGRGETITLERFADASIDVDDVLRPSR